MPEPNVKLEKRVPFHEEEGVVPESGDKVRDKELMSRIKRATKEEKKKMKHEKLDGRMAGTWQMWDGQPCRVEARATRALALGEEKGKVCLLM